VSLSVQMIGAAELVAALKELPKRATQKAVVRRALLKAAEPSVDRLGRPPAGDRAAGDHARLHRRRAAAAHAGLSGAARTQVQVDVWSKDGSRRATFASW
jgi:hypothetical protein